MTAEPIFTGVGVALVTLFDESGRVDADATAEHAAWLVDAGMRAVITAGTTGEASALEPAERAAVLSAVRSRIPAGVPVIAGTGAPSIRQARALTEEAAAAGADGIIALSPAGSRDLVDYYRAVTEAANGLPVLGYHFPVSSAPGIDLALLDQLDLHGLKDSTGDAERLLVELDHLNGNIYTGSSALLSFAGPVGAPGAILALANVAPELCIAAFDGDAAAQRALLPQHMQQKLGAPRSLKQMMAAKFGVSPTTRI